MSAVGVLAGRGGRGGGAVVMEVSEDDKRLVGVTSAVGFSSFLLRLRVPRPSAEQRACSRVLNCASSK